MHKRQCWGGVGLSTPRFRDRGSWMRSWRLHEILFYPIWEWSTLQSGDFPEIYWFLYIIKPKFRRWYPSILCYEPPSVEILGPTTPTQFLNSDPRPPVFKLDWRLWLNVWRWIHVTGWRHWKTSLDDVGVLPRAKHILVLYLYDSASETRLGIFNTRRR